MMKLSACITLRAELHMCIHYMYMNNHVHSAPQLEGKKEKNREERRITHYKIDNNLNGLEKYSIIFGEQSQHVHVHVHVHVLQS